MATLSKIFMGVLMSVFLSLELSPIVNPQNTQETKYIAYKVKSNTAAIRTESFKFRYKTPPKTVKKDQKDQIVNKHPVIFFFGESQNIYLPYLDGSTATNYFDKNREFANGKDIILLDDYLYGITETGIELQIKRSTLLVTGINDKKLPVQIEKHTLWLNHFLSDYKSVCKRNWEDDENLIIGIRQSNYLHEWLDTLEVAEPTENIENIETSIDIRVNQKKFTENGHYPEFRRYEIRYETGASLVFFAHIVRDCNNHMIKKVKIKEYTENDWEARQDYDISHSTEDRDLRDSTYSDEDLIINSENDHKYYHNGYTYLYSVNSVKQYNNLIKYLKRQGINNKVLANFLISEFNITCWSGKRSLCKKHDYSEDEFK